MLLGTKIIEGFPLPQNDDMKAVTDSLEAPSNRVDLTTIAKKSTTFAEKQNALGSILKENPTNITEDHINSFVKFCDILIQSHNVESKDEFIGIFCNGGYPELFRQFHTQETALNEENVLRKAS